MGTKRQTILAVGVVALTVFVTAFAPVVLLVMARPPGSWLASQIGLFLARSLPSGRVVDSSTQALGGPAYWLLPPVAWLSSAELGCLILQVLFQLAVCVAFVEVWIRQARPVRPSEVQDDRLEIYARAMAIGLVWALSLAVCVSQIRIVLVSWHNETIGQTWQIYDGGMDVESTAAKITAVSALVLYLGGAALIARREVQRAQARMLASRPAGSCPACGYSAAGLVKCPECGKALHESNTTERHTGPLQASLLGTWWRISILAVVGLTIGAGILAPLTLGIVWTIRHG